MIGSGRYPPSLVARRIVVRTIRYFARDSVFLLLVATLAAFLVFGGAGARADGMSATSAMDDPAERYMRGLQEQDVAEVFASLSPELRRSLEQRTGLAGAAAVAALFVDQERRGERVVDYELVGRYDTVQGESLRFYVVQAQRGHERRDIPYTLTVSPDGTVAKIE
ncbi:MAG: hypothetical protein M3O34_02205 [Chloroflexota bacterium]|nr:hypothetical protein [Chloroflexota bacterium]